jgi:hypothetical protein
MNPPNLDLQEWNTIKRRLDVVERDTNLNRSQIRNCEKVFEDMYVGDGKENPSMTSRMNLVEEAIDRWSRDSTQIKRWLFGILASLLVNIILHFWK